MRARILKILLSLPFLIAAGIFGLYLIFGFLLVNPLAKKILPWVGEEKLASQLSAQRVDFNPLTLEATVQGLKLAEKNGKPLAGFDSLYVNLDTVGLFRFAWRLSDVQLSGPYADFAVNQGGKLNWADLIAKLNEDKKPPKDTMPRVLVDHIKIEKGDIEYTDANRVGDPFHVQLRPLGIELEGLSTLPEDRGNYLVTAKLPEQGGTFKWKGDVSLNPLKSDGEVALEGVSLTNMLNVIKTPRNFEIPSGTLAAGTRYSFTLVQDKSGQDKPWIKINGANVVLQDLALAPRGGGKPVFELEEAKVGNASLDLYKQDLDVAEVSLKNGKVFATVQANGKLDWQALLAVASDVTPPAKADAKPESSKNTAAPWKLSVKSVHVEGWEGRYTDNGYVSPLRVEAAGFGFDAELEGEIGSKPAIMVGPVNAKLGPVKVLSGDEKVLELGNTSLANASFNVADNKLDIESIEFGNAKTDVVIGKDKELNWNKVLAKHAGTGKPANKPAATKQSGMKMSLNRLGLNGLQVAVMDQSLSTPMKLDVVDGYVRLKNLSLDLDKAISLESGFNVRQGGKFSANGSLVPGKAIGKLNLKLAALSLKPFAPYVNQFARLELQSGAANTNGKLGFARTQKGMKLDYNGGFSVSDLAIIEEDTAEAFLGWEKLYSDNLQVGLAPNKLHMNELVAVHPFGKIIIFEDKSMNLKRIQRSTKPAAEAKTVEAKPTETQTGSKAKEDVSPIAVERLRIDNANAEFADLSLPTPFGTRMHSLSGVITGLSTDSTTTAQVELDGSVDEYGSARVRGSIQPFQATEFTDISLIFRNLEMTNLTPYSGKFAGRKIDSGKLSVDLQYKIKQRQLAGENKFVINKLKLGDQVDSPDAMKLPLDLAIALLQDSNGIIDVDIPITGNLDDPQFSYGRIVWKAVVNVLTKIVTEPFRALGNLLGISSEKLEAINFDPGSDKLLPPEQEKLKALSEAMAKRPVLSLTVEPSYDPESDRRALQEMAMRREAVTVAGIKLAAGEAPGPVDVNNYKIQTWLEDRFAEKAGKEEYKKLRDSYKGKDAGVGERLLESQFVERLGRQFKTRDDGPASAFHAELLERLTRLTKIEDAALVKLAQSRGQVMHDALIKLGLDARRVSVGKPGSQSAKDKLVANKMSLGVSKEPAIPAAPEKMEPEPASP